MNISKRDRESAHKTFDRWIDWLLNVESDQRLSFEVGVNGRGEFWVCLTADGDTETHVDYDGSMHEAMFFATESFIGWE